MKIKKKFRGINSSRLVTHLRVQTVITFHKMINTKRRNRLVMIGATIFVALMLFIAIPTNRITSVRSAGKDEAERSGSSAAKFDALYRSKTKTAPSEIINDEVKADPQVSDGIYTSEQSADKESNSATKKPPKNSAVKESTKDKLVASDSKECTKKLEYVSMIDAGSTGSRIHVYTFDTCYSPPKLLDEQFKMLNPGLSSFDTDTVGAANSLDPLLKVALDTIPKKKRGCSPVALKATAGLRLLGEEKSSAILSQVRKHLEKDYPFPVVSGDGVSIMDGSDEGVYAWITANFLLGNIGSKDKSRTAAVFDLGGGSTQIVFEPTDGEKMIDGEHKYTISFGGRDFTLYQYSHLGYGLMEGRAKVNGLVVKLLLEKDGSKLGLTPLSESEIDDANTLEAKVTLKHPCLPPGVTAKNVKVQTDDKKTYLVNFISMSKDENDPIAASASTQCRFLTETVLNKDKQCESGSCSFNGIYQPSLRHQFPASSDMFVFSYFYDRLQPIGIPQSFTLKEMSDITQLVCSGSSIWNEFFVQKSTIQKLEDEPLWCLDLSFMTSLLHSGYDIPLDRELRTAKTIAGNELGWCLGASLPLLDKDSGWKCKVTKDY